MYLSKIYYNKLKLFIIISFFCVYNKTIFLILPIYDKPLVSIIIPVHNHYFYTLCCISSILKISPIVPYEIIIADDMSDDATKLIEKYIKNIKIIHNNKKYNYLINCNKASKTARGKFILFLNNDTKVNKEWLISLVNLIEKDDKIGMVGSKLIYPNGKLQEAGGIVFRNGDCLNFGRNDKADLPEYNYVKEVDYISGASILIRKSIWDKIGGFDERFFPAYYEDTDLAFKIRNIGYKVLYQPKSIVTHYEGISNGRDLNSGIKKFQLINKNKFTQKWENKLKLQDEKNNTFIARDRSYNKSKILVIDRFVPNFDKDAGGRSTFMYLNIFKEIGLQVTFLGNDFKRREPYTSILQQIGIEVLYGKIPNFIKL